jgi:hypothetical protein
MRVDLISSGYGLGHSRLSRAHAIFAVNYSLAQANAIR